MIPVVFEIVKLPKLSQKVEDTTRTVNLHVKHVGVGNSDVTKASHRQNKVVWRHSNELNRGVVVVSSLHT
jgi:hypothetical protein